jgi:hypothetical protein
MPFDTKIQQNLKSALVEQAFLGQPRKAHMLADRICASVPMEKETVTFRSQMDRYELDDSNGNAPSPIKHRDPVYADVKLKVLYPSEGETFDRNDVLNYQVKSKLDAFGQTAGVLPYVYGTKIVTQLLVRGHLDKCDYDGANFFATHNAVPSDASTSFVNNIDCGLVGTAPGALTSTQIRDAIARGFEAAGAVGVGQGFKNDIFEPDVLITSSLAKRSVTDALNAKFISVGGGSQDNTAFQSDYPVEIFNSAAISRWNTIIGAATLGVTNPGSVMWLICPKFGQSAAGILHGIYDPYTLRTGQDLMIAGTNVDGYSGQLKGAEAFNFGFPHFIFRLY